MKSLFQKFDIYLFITVIILLIFFIFPTNNHLSDSYDYAASVRYGIKLFSAHHLLYNSSNYLIKEFLSLFVKSIDVLRLMQYVNAFFAIFCAFLLRTILINYLKNSRAANIWTIFSICSFGFMRFSTEAETFIIPIFISLVSTYFFQKYLKENKNKYAFYTGVFASIACLFHQIHLFWGIGLFVGFLLNGKLKSVLYFLAFTPSVILIYALVLVKYNNVELSYYNLISFIANYYYSENAETNVTINNLIVTLITFVRTFFQVHGSILVILEKYKVAILAIPFVLYLISVAFYNIFKSTTIIKDKTNDTFAKTHLIIFFLQLSFAFFSYGNSEFMVMLPFLLALFLSSFFEINLKGIQYFTLGMFIWNMSFGLIPNHYVDYLNNKSMINLIKEESNAYFIIKENYLISNYYYYEFGIESYDKILPINYDLKKKFANKGSTFYTDLLTKKTPMGRLEFTTKFDISKFEFIRHRKWINNTMGGFYIDEVKIKDLNIK